MNSIEELGGLDNAAKVIGQSILDSLDEVLPVEGETKQSLLWSMDIHREIQNYEISLDEADILEKPVNDYLIVKSRV